MSPGIGVYYSSFKFAPKTHFYRNVAKEIFFRDLAKRHFAEILPTELLWGEDTAADAEAAVGATVVLDDRDAELPAQEPDGCDEV